MNATEMLDALKAAADVMRRMDPAWCALHDVPQTTDAEMDAAMQAVEDAIDNAEPQPAEPANGIEAALAAVGGSQAALAGFLGVSQQAVSQWVRQGYVPLRRAMEIHAMLGIDRLRLVNPTLADLVADKEAA
jgi:DNA-binding transcriptional regulator YiaG